ncbi:hypothetical protein HK405_007458 [Cladochytrium tenue]|nr:hypothetical protein HK405_007458 [Cladochytrium tenue]
MSAADELALMSTCLSLPALRCLQLRVWNWDARWLKDFIAGMPPSLAHVCLLGNGTGMVHKVGDPQMAWFATDSFQGVTPNGDVKRLMLYYDGWREAFVQVQTGGDEAHDSGGESETSGDESDGYDAGGVRGARGGPVLCRSGANAEFFDVVRAGGGDRRSLHTHWDPCDDLLGSDDAICTRTSIWISQGWLKTWLASFKLS